MDKKLKTKLFDIGYLSDLANKYGTPLYVYSEEIIKKSVKAYTSSFGSHPHSIRFAVKSNSNLSILSILNEIGCGFDVVSIGELHRCIAIGANPQNIIFSGCGKTEFEIEEAMKQNIGCLNIESMNELFAINKMAKAQNKNQAIGIRVNPNIKIDAHKYISTGSHENKFGVTMSECIKIFYLIKEGKLQNIKVIGIGFHIGSQQMSVLPICKAMDCILPIICAFDQISNIFHIDIGGGFGINYKMAPFEAMNGCNVKSSMNECDLYYEFEQNLFEPINAFIQKIKKTLSKYPKYCNLRITVEPGRSIVGYAGILLTKVLDVKKRRDSKKNFVVVDASMTELIRPSLYGSYHPIVLLKERKNGIKEAMNADIVGPVCESGDYLGKDRKICNVKKNDFMAICHCGAYGFVMSSNYNSRTRAMEILIDEKNKNRVIKQRQSIADMLKNEIKCLL